MKKILNVGCGNEKYGTHFVDLYPTRKEVIKCDVDKEKLPFPDEYFDIVYSKNLLEHLRNPGFAIEEMFRVLKKGGKIILITDNAGFWEFHIFGTHVKPKLNFMTSNFYRGRGRLDTHYCLYTKEHLINHLRRVGFKIIETKFIDFETNHKNLGKFRKILNIILIFLRIFKITENFSYPRIKIIGEK
ncbi:MAG: methyltransferase domain-containing protein [Candidatus Aenigmatarchaeota archaeon]